MTEVYANANEIAGKAGMNKVIAAFPDVCMSPPSPPAGPIPVPYPDTSFSTDLKEGSRTVKLGGKPAALAQQSYYKASILGDEAATRAFGMNVITHQITGKTYFQAWSMDVKIEGKNVCRHLDITTSNHASYPGGSGPMTSAEKLALDRINAAKPKCPCCGKALHAIDSSSTTTKVAWQSTDTPMHMEEWYEMNIKRKFLNPATQATKLADFKTLMNDARSRAGCTCKSKKTRILPEAPCDVFFDNPDPVARKARKDFIVEAWDHYKKNSTYQSRHGIRSPVATAADLTTKLGRAPSQKEVQDQTQVNHLTPKSAGGCPTGNNNLQPNKQLCASCQSIDGRFSQFQ